MPSAQGESRQHHRIYETHVVSPARPAETAKVTAKTPARIELFCKTRVELRDRLRLLSSVGFSSFSIVNIRDDDHLSHVEKRENTPQEHERSRAQTPQVPTSRLSLAEPFSAPQSGRKGNQTGRGAADDHNQDTELHAADSKMLEWLQICLDEVPGCSLCVHYALRHNMDAGGTADTFARFTRFLSKLNTLKRSESQRVEVLLISGPGPKAGPKTPLDSVACLERLMHARSRDQWADLGVAFNPHYQDAAQVKAERVRLQRKLATRRVQSVWLQFGCDAQRLEESLQWLMKKIDREDFTAEGVTVVGSLLLPTKQLLMQKSSRSWEGTFLSEAYLTCTEQAEAISKDILTIYARYGVELLVEAPGVQSLEDIALVQSLLASVPARQPRIHERAAAAATPVSPTGPEALADAPGARLAAFPSVSTSDSVVQNGPNSAAASAASLAGGYKVGDRVRALVGDAYAKVSAGDEGTVVGQCNSKCADKAERVLVDFKRDRNFWDFIVQHSHVKQYSDGDVIAEEGEVQVSLHFVKSGTVQEVVGVGSMRTLLCPSHWGPDSLQTALDHSQLLPARLVAQGSVEVYIIPVKELCRRERLPLQAFEKFFQDLQTCQRVNFRAEDEICSCEIKGERNSRTAPQTIFVTETRTGKSMALEVEASDTVYMVKCAIQEIDGTLPERQELMYAGKLLEDSRSLDSYKIRKHANLHWGLYRADVKEDIQRQRQHHLDLVTRPDFFFKSIRLDITLHESSSQILSKMEVERAAGAPESATLRLDGISDPLQMGVFIDGAPVPTDRLVWEGSRLQVRGPLGREWGKWRNADEFILESNICTGPRLNKQIASLSRRSGFPNLCLCCEQDLLRSFTLIPTDLFGASRLGGDVPLTVRIDHCHQSCLTCKKARESRLLTGNFSQCYPAGDYSGSFAEGKRHGAGVMRYHNGEVFNGEWEHGSPRAEGKCRYSWPDGKTFDGEWHHDIVLQGVSMEAQAYGDVEQSVRYQVQFDDGIYTGELLALPTQTSKQGAVERPIKHGLGIMEYENGDVYTGAWQLDKKHGNGAHVTAAGMIYEGEFDRDHRSGRGQITWSNGSKTTSGLPIAKRLDRRRQQDVAGGAVKMAVRKQPAGCSASWACNDCRRLRMKQRREGGGGGTPTQHVQHAGHEDAANVSHEICKGYSFCQIVGGYFCRESRT